MFRIASFESNVHKKNYKRKITNKVMRVIFNLTEIRFFDNLNLLFGNSLELCNL